MTQLVDAFRDRAEVAGFRVHRVAGPVEAATLVRGLHDGEPVVTPTVTWTWAGFVDALGGHRVAGDDPTAVADLPLGITSGELAVAETGSVLVVEDDLAHRLVSMLTQRLVLLVRGADLVGSLDDAAERLAARPGPGYAVLMTGPSRTADIERSLTIGVQGPSVVDVVVVG